MSKYYVYMTTALFEKSGIYTFSGKYPTETEIKELTENLKYRIVFMQRLER